MAVYEVDGTTISEEKRNGITRYSFNDFKIYRINVESVPGFITNVYLLMDSEVSLIDVGSNREEACADLEKGFNHINSYFNENIGLRDVDNVIITHGHGDHFAMLLAHEELQDKRVYIHELDSLVLTDYAANYLNWEAGVARLTTEANLSYCPDRGSFFGPNRMTMRPNHHNLVEVVDGEEIVNGYKVYHTPGHSPGHICLKVGPILFCGDHILSSTTPHQQPRSNGEWVGLERYLSSLRKIGDLGETLGLAGHEQPILPLERRIGDIDAFHQQRLKEIVQICREQKGLYQITRDYYAQHPEFIKGLSLDKLTDQEKFGAMEEVMAHVEYLLDNETLEIYRDNGTVAYRAR